MCRRLACLALICVLGLASTAYADLIGHWTLDEGTGAVAADSSGKNNNGTFVNAPVWTDGMLAGALEFNGASAVDCGSEASLAVTGPITIGAWIKPALVTGSKSIVGRNAGYTFKTYNNTLRFTTPGVRDHTAANTVVETGVWQHVAVSFTPGLADGAVFYLNGNETSRTLSSAIAAGTGPFRIANNQFNEWFTGVIDDVRVYDHALMQAEIQAAMNDEAFAFAAVTSPKDGSSVGSRLVTLQW